MTSLPYRSPSECDSEFPGVSEKLPVEQCETDTTTVDVPISEDIVSGFGEGSHDDPASVPSRGTSLPPIDELKSGIRCINTYLERAGAAVLADLQLDGLAAPVAYTDANTVFAYIDESIFESLITDVLVTYSHITSPLDESSEQLVTAISAVHNMEFTHQTRSLDEDPVDIADWPAVRQKQTHSPTGLVFHAPHPFRELQNHPHLPERAIALVAGIQHLTIDLNSHSSQVDLALPYLAQYLMDNGVTKRSAVEEIASWYELEPECVAFSVDELQARLTPEALSVRDPVFKYYLTESVAEKLISSED